MWDQENIQVWTIAVLSFEVEGSTRFQNTLYTTKMYYLFTVNLTKVESFTGGLKRHIF